MSTRKQQAQKQSRKGRSSNIGNIDKRAKRADEEDDQPSLANTEERIAAYEKNKKLSIALGKSMKTLMGKIDKVRDSESCTPEVHELGRDMLRLMNQMNEVEEGVMELGNTEMKVSTKAMDEYENLYRIHNSLELKWARDQKTLANLAMELEQMRATQAAHKKIHIKVVAERDEARSQLKQLANEKKDVVQQSAKQRRQNGDLKRQQCDQEKEIARLALCETRPCPICYEERQPCALVPCGHTGCRECLSMLKRCHICRAAPTLIIDLHL
jgi:chromosome segregation ATPase